ncbi:MAG: glycosyltransferase [Negativicutes bacterium]|nr:glycosyltransferase [Negativicutes bacterium]
MQHWADIVMVPVQALIILFTFYYFFIAFFGLKNQREKGKIYRPHHKFALIVCAHNEQAVIGQLVENLKRLRYPASLYDIFVVADNCRDNTADVARRAGAIVYERSNQREKGKGYAMEWMFARLFAMERNYDAVCVFDADNLVHCNFLLEMNSRLLKGEKIIQGFLDAKNPHDTWISATFALSFWVVNYIWHLAKYRLGLSSVLGGTGMCIAMDVLRKYGWGATCLTEDMEFTMKALVNGIRTTWAHEAIVWDEKPLTFAQAWNQRKRWAQGHFDVAARYIPRLLREGIRRRDIRILDGVIHLVQPHFLILSSLFIIASYVRLFVPFYTNVLYSLIPFEVWEMVMIGQYLFPVIVLYKMRADVRTWLYSLLYPLFIYSWIPITFLGFKDRKKNEWSHTVHTRSISYEQIIACQRLASDDGEPGDGLPADGVAVAEAKN